MIQICALASGPPRRARKARERPSGDQRGAASFGPAVKRRGARLPSLGTAQICAR